MRVATVHSLEPRAAEAKAAVSDAMPPRLGRGVVTAVQGSTVTVALAGGVEVEAELALALPYAAELGDVLLVIGEANAYFVIGVISGRGKTSLELQGNVSLRAVGGMLELKGDEGVHLEGPAVEVKADKLNVVARSVVETFTSLFQRVSEVLHVHTRQEVLIVDEGSYRQAKTASLQTEETVTINGKEIHLG